MFTMDKIDLLMDLGCEGSGTMSCYDLLVLRSGLSTLFRFRSARAVAWLCLSEMARRL